MKIENYSYWLKLFNEIPIPKNLIEIKDYDFIIKDNSKDRYWLNHFGVTNKDNIILKVTKETINKIESIKKYLKKDEKIVILSAYRTPELLAALWTRRLNDVINKFPGYSYEKQLEFASKYTASPFHPNLPPHSRGSSIDVLLIKNNKILKFCNDDTDYNEWRFDYFENKDKKIHENRLRLKNIMCSAGFIPYSKEYNHFGLTSTFEGDDL